MSLPVRGAWIEIGYPVEDDMVLYRRSPCGERGLKYLFEGDDCGHDASLPVRGAWIEIERCAMVLRYSAVAPRAGSVD